MSNNFIYSDPNKPSNTDNIDMYYGLIEDYDFIDSDNNPRIKVENDSRVLAKIKFRANGTQKFLVKIDNAKKLYNPSSQLSENKQRTLLDQYSGSQNNFKEVSQKVFDLYITFLRTSNPLWINNAEREAF